jgi:hypothetical protein
MALKFYHFSIDDVFNCLLEVSQSPELILQHHFFGFLQQLHHDFDAIIDLYVFLQGSDCYAGKSLEQVSSQLQSSFASLPWLRFGPHSQNRATPLHAQAIDQQLITCQATFEQIARFAGSSSFSQWIRFHYFSECFELAPYLKSQGVTTLLTTDKPAISYRLPPPQRGQLEKLGATDYNEIGFVRSHIRIEDLVGSMFTSDELDDELIRRVGKADCAVVFTHEYELNRPEVRTMTRRVMDWIQRKNLAPVSTVVDVQQAT